MDIIQPTSVTDSGGQEIVKKSVARGDVISDGTNDRILSGFHKGGFGDKDFGFKVSQEGYDVKTASDDQLVMSSAFNMFKIVDSGTVTTSGFTADAAPVGGYKNTSGSVATVNHNLGFVPAVHAYINYGGQYIQLPHTVYFTLSGTDAVWLTITYVISDTQLDVYYNVFLFDIEIDQEFSGGDVVKYYLLQETAT